MPNGANAASTTEINPIFPTHTIKNGLCALSHLCTYVNMSRMVLRAMHTCTQVTCFTLSAGRSADQPKTSAGQPRKLSAGRSAKKGLNDIDTHQTKVPATCLNGWLNRR